MTKEKIIEKTSQSIDYITKQLILINAQLKTVTELDNFDQFDCQQIAISLKSLLASQAELLQERIIEKM